jgi:hypothetical protein
MGLLGIRGAARGSVDWMLGRQEFRSPGGRLMTRDAAFGCARLYIMTWPLNLVAAFLLLEVFRVPDDVLLITFIPLLLAELVVEFVLRWRWPCPGCGQVFDTTTTKRGFYYFNVFRLTCIHCGYRIFGPLPAQPAPAADRGRE